MEPPPPSQPPPPPQQPPPSTTSQPSPPLFSDPPPSQPPPQPPQQIPNTNPNHTLTSYPPPQNPNPNPIRSISLTSYAQPAQQPPQLNDNNNNNNNNRGGGAPLTRSWSHSHFPTTTTTTTTSSQLGFAIGVPAVSSQPAFSSSFGPPYGGGGGGVGGASFVSSSSPSQARATMQGMSGMGIIGSQIRPGGVAPSGLHPQRPVQTTSTIRPQTASSNLSSIPQNFQGHGILRASSITTTTSTSNTSQSHQPWLSAPHVRPPLPSQPPLRAPLNSQSLPSRPQQPPQQPPQPLHPPPQPPHHHLPPPNQSQDNFGQQRVSQPLANQPPLGSFPRVQGATNQRPPVPLPSSVNLSGPTDTLNASNALESSEQCSTILSKRNIQELVNQIDPSEKLDPDVEDVLVDIAEDFIDSVTTFGCSLAKHRKSNTLEAKDILLHLERTWNMTLPGFSGDEIKTFKKPVANDIHKERVTLIKKSLAGAETGSTKPSVGPMTGNMKGHLAKATTNVVGS